MSAEENKTIVRRYQEAHNQNNLAALNDIVAADLISHNKLPGTPPGLEGGKAVHQMIASAVPDLHTEIEDLIAEGDRVAVRFIVSGTDKGGLMGVPATGRSYKTPGISVFRIANGKIVEHWGMVDQVSVMQQLGKLPS